MRKQTKLVAALSATALLAIGASAVTFAAGWNNTTGNWQYLDNDGNPVADDWRKSGDYWFYLGSDGNMATNEVVQKNDDFYYVNQDGAMVTNQWVAFDTVSDDSNADHRWMYFGADGKAYRDKKDGITVSDIKTINGKKYLFDQEGYMLYGWLSKEASTLQLEDDAWSTANYYYGGYDDGSAQHGWVQLTVNDNGEDSTAWFYLDDNGKITKNQKKTINGATYYFKNDGRMIEDWSNATKTGSPSELTAVQTGEATSSTIGTVYVNGDGGARKNQWIWAVPSAELDSTDNENETASWWYGDNTGKLIKNKIKKIKGKTYAFDSIGRMLGGLQVGSVGNFKSGYDANTGYTDDTGLRFAADSTLGDIYYFSGDYKKDGSRKTGYQKVDFDDDTYQMYFNNDGTAAKNYVNKIKKYAQNGIILAANNDDSNYALVGVLSDPKMVDALDPISYVNSSSDVNNHNSLYANKVLVNTAGTVMKGKTNLKDSNDVYYITDKNNGKVLAVSTSKFVTPTAGNANSRTMIYGVDGTTQYWIQKD